MKRSFLAQTFILSGSLLLQFTTLCFHARGAAGDLDLAFDPGGGVNGPVNAIVLQADGKVIIGGQFTTVRGLVRTNLARLNSDGSGDSTFNPDTGLTNLSNFYVTDIALQPDGKVVLCGSSLSESSGSWTGYAVRLNNSGALDSNFIAATGSYPYGSTFTSIALQPDRKLLVGGSFEDIYHSYEHGDWLYSRSFLTRLNPNGTSDASFAAAMETFDDPYDNVGISLVALQPNGKVLIGIWGYWDYKIARLNTNGSLDTTFNTGTGVTDGHRNGVNSVAVQSDGKVLIGGDFTAVNGTNRNRIARLNSNGSLDSSFNPGTGADGIVSSIVVQPDGKVLIGGDFATVNGTARNRMARLNADGSLDGSFNLVAGADGVVRSIALQSDGNILIGGDFTTVNGVLRPHVARLYGDAAMPLPSLNIVRSNASVILSWPLTGLNFQLQESTNLALPNSWSFVAQPAVTNAGQFSVTVSTGVGRKFFRLESQ